MFFFILLYHSDFFLPTHCRCTKFSLHLITHNDKHKLGRASLEKESACRRYLYLTTYNTHKRERYPCLQRVSSPRSQQVRGRKTHALDREANEIGTQSCMGVKLGLSH